MYFEETNNCIVQTLKNMRNISWLTHKYMQSYFLSFSNYISRYFLQILCYVPIAYTMIALFLKFFAQRDMRDFAYLLAGFTIWGLWQKVMNCFWIILAMNLRFFPFLKYLLPRYADDVDAIKFISTFSIKVFVFIFWTP